MTALILTAQVLPPLLLALIAWLAFLPSGNLIGVMAQAAGTGAVLVAVALVAQWAAPVWWLPRVNLNLLQSLDRRRPQKTGVDCLLHVR